MASKNAQNNSFALTDLKFHKLNCLLLNQKWIFESFKGSSNVHGCPKYVATYFGQKFGQNWGLQKSIFSTKIFFLSLTMIFVFSRVSYMTCVTSNLVQGSFKQNKFTLDNFPIQVLNFSISSSFSCII